MSITFNNVTYATGYSGEDNGKPSTSFGLDNVSTNSIVVSGTVSQIGDTVTVTGLLPGSGDTGNTSMTNTLYVTQYDNSGMIEFSDTPPAQQSAASFRYVLSNSVLTANQKVTFTSDSAIVNNTSGDAYQPVCFASGTRIRVARGGAEVDVAVEDLAVGDLAVTSSGALRPIRWIGRRLTRCRRHPDPRLVMPVRVRADAFAPGLPARDLVVSPGHALCLDVCGEVLVPAIALVDGVAIVQEAVDAVTYWHVELDGHDVLLAEGMPAESYLDMGNRGFFTDAAVVDLVALPDAAGGRAGFCRPFHDAGPVVEALRELVRGRAAAPGRTSGVAEAASPRPARRSAN